MSSLELKVPPPVVGLAAMAAMYGISRIDPSIPAGADHAFAATIIALGGLGVDIAGILAFRRAKTTVNPLKPDNTTSLVVTGVYRITRNPMYSGLLLLLVAWAVYLASPWSLVGPLAFVLFINRFQITPEERILEQRFGDDFLRYKKKVKRWL